MTDEDYPKFTIEQTIQRIQAKEIQTNGLFETSSQEDEDEPGDDE
ncbi:hypothetical protein [Alicyclobacillus acidiphilus]|nr:hypothetical protein [Alicyclobacillus acidiphilus]